MKPKSIIIAASSLVSFLSGASEVWFTGAHSPVPEFALFLPIIISLGLILTWVHIDSKEHNYVRPAIINMGIVALALVFIPIYLFKSRPTGARAKALGGFVIILIGYFAVATIGATFAQYVKL
jgi:hypothetical protein